jgi:outer membrane cobalamin receptor
MARSTRATLESNATSTPIRPQQDRGFSDIYANGSLTFHSGAHDLKAGGELTASTVDEAFASETFAFADRRHGREQAAYVQDLIRVGPATVSVGVRYDHYSLVEHEQAFSPRISASYFVERRRLVVHGSYDRAFETPPVENVLLASSGEAPLRSSRGHFFEAGVAKELFGRARVDVNAYRRADNKLFRRRPVIEYGRQFPVHIRQRHNQRHRHQSRSAALGAYRRFLPL